MKYVGNSPDLKDLVGEKVKVIVPSKSNYRGRLKLVQFEEKHWGHAGLHDARSSGKTLPPGSCYWVLPEDLK